MTDVESFEQRQWWLIRDQLDSYEKGEVQLESLIGGLNALSAVLSETDRSKELREHWWTLEQLLAVGMDRSDIAGVLSDNKPALDDALTQIRRLANEALASVKE